LCAQGNRDQETPDPERGTAHEIKNCFLMKLNKLNTIIGFIVLPSSFDYYNIKFSL
jgi:hypothetical protein